jgi:hypothetical protein
LGYQLTNYVSMSNYTSYEWYFEDEGYYTSLLAQNTYFFYWFFLLIKEKFINFFKNSH